MHDGVLGRALDDQRSRKPALHARERMIDKREPPGAMNLQIDDGCATGRHTDGLDAR
jgi:hypothetical protein